MDANSIKKELLKRAAAKNTPQFKLEEYCFDKQLAFIQDPSRFKTAVCSRRSGKCRPAGSLIKTPTGSVKIEDLKIGDSVYGYNSDGSVSLTTVTDLWDQGIKEVVDLQYDGVTYASSTLDHKWLAHNTYKDLRTVKPLKEFNSRDKIATEYIKIPGGNIVFPYAYSLGAILGDGCSRDPGLVISGTDTVILDKVAGELNVQWKHSGYNNFSNRFYGANKLNIPFYKEWAHNKYAHEKTCDLSVIRTWTRKSQLQFIAGLIDTDGSVGVYNGRLIIRLGMQAKHIIDTVKILLLDLFQVVACSRLDSRKKYKNGPIHILSVSRNIDAKRILKELPTVCERKKWKEEYENLLENNTSSKFIGVSVTNLRKEQCYDITINNDTHLFLDATGMVGHNTISCAADLMHTVTSLKGDVAYITLSRKTAKKIIWRELKSINKAFALGAKFDNTELSAELPNGNMIYVSGAKDASEIEKFRGLALRKVYIDETQSFRPYIKELIDDVIEPALTDYYGSLCLIGTPGPVPAGYFYDISRNKEWSHHHWTMQDNPHIALKSGKDPLEIIRELASRRGLTLNSPSIQREYFGQWKEDNESRVFLFTEALNVTQSLPNFTDMTFIFGIDIGWKDSDAIAVLGYHHHSKNVYLVHEYVQNKNDITALVDEIKRLQALYNPVKMVMDAGALGKKIQEEIRHRHGLNLEAADKHRKHEFIKLLNDDLRTGKLKALPKSRFEEDCMLVQWDWTDPVKPKISDTYHSDINDAVLYAWRECKHFFYEAPAPVPHVNSNEYEAAEEQRLAEALEAKLKGPDEFTDVNSWGDLGVTDEWDDSF